MSFISLSRHTQNRDAPQHFSLPLACEKYDLNPQELEQAMKVLEVPRILERKGQKFGYWA